MFTGAITALITPFKNGKVDEQAYQDFILWQIKQGIHGVVVSGTTGESPTLSHAEHERVFAIGVEAASGRVPVIAGAGSNCTDEAISLAKNAKKVGADAILVATPYYNKPSQEGLYQHYKAINDAVEIPIILYNIPGRSVIDMSDDTIVRLSKLANIVGLKDATGDLARVMTLRNKLGKKEFCLLSGEDITAVAFNAQGGQGVISVTSNVAPKFVANVQNLMQRDKYKFALELQEKLTPLHLAMFCDTNPGPAKYAVSLLGKCETGLRLPLLEPSEDSKKAIKKAVKDLGLI